MTQKYLLQIDPSLGIPMGEFIDLWNQDNDCSNLGGMRLVANSRDGSPDLINLIVTAIISISSSVTAAVTSTIVIEKWKKKVSEKLGNEPDVIIKTDEATGYPLVILQPTKKKD